MGLFLERWPLRLVGLLGVLKAGAAYLPLDPEHPAERLASAFQDSGATVLLSRGSVRDRLPSFGATAVVLLDHLIDSSTPDDPGNPGVPVDGDNLAYVIFTSGSTGRPKGVMVHHRGLLAAASAWEDALRPAGRDRDGTSRPRRFAFDVFTGDWVRASPPAARSSPARGTSCSTRLALPVSSGRERSTASSSSRPSPRPWPSTSRAGPAPSRCPSACWPSGSDTLRSGLLRRLRRLVVPGGRVVNSYGLTEATDRQHLLRSARRRREPRP